MDAPGRIDRLELRARISRTPQSSAGGLATLLEVPRGHKSQALEASLRTNNAAPRAAMPSSFSQQEQQLQALRSSRHEDENERRAGAER